MLKLTMPNNLNLSKNIVSLFIILLFSSCLFGCSNLFTTSQSESANFSLQGNVYSQSIDIPDNSTVTLSIAPIESNHISGETSFDYRFITQGSSRTLPFAIDFAPKSENNNSHLGISVRIEKEGELIMMSNKIMPLTLNFAEKLALPVTAL